MLISQTKPNRYKHHKRANLLPRFASLFVVATILLIASDVTAESQQSKQPGRPKTPWPVIVRFGSLYMRHSNFISSIAFSPDDKTVLTGSYDRTARLWDARTGELIRTFKGHKGLVASVAFSPSGKKIVTGDRDDKVHVWNVATGKLTHVMRMRRIGLLRVTFGLDDNTVMAASPDGYVRIWNISKQKTKPKPKPKVKPSAKKLPAWMTHKRKPITQEEAKELARKYPGRFIYKPPPSPPPAKGKLIRIVKGVDIVRTYALAFSADRKTVLRAGGDKTVRWRSITKGKILPQYKPFQPDIPPIRDKTYIAGKVLKEFKGHEYRLTHVEFSPDGKSILTADGGRGFWLWDMASGEVVRVFKGHKSRIETAAFSPDGKTILTSSDDDGVWLWM